MRIAFWLPRNAESIGVARRALDQIFTTLGVRSDCREEIALAVTEACSNAVLHADRAPVYELAAEAEDSNCVITVTDDGPGLTEAPPATMPDSGAVRGRGLAMIRATTDAMWVRQRLEGGLSIRMAKTLHWQDGAFGSLSL
jgi:serine/threonine-protein kinase RsbW